MPLMYADEDLNPGACHWHIPQLNCHSHRATLPLLIFAHQEKITRPWVWCGLWPHGKQTGGRLKAHWMLFFFKPVALSSTRRDSKCIDDKVARDSAEAAQFLSVASLNLKQLPCSVCCHVLAFVVEFQMSGSAGGESYLFCLYKTKTVTEYAVQC